MSCGEEEKRSRSLGSMHAARSLQVLHWHCRSHHAACHCWVCRCCLRYSLCRWQVVVAIVRHSTNSPLSLLTSDANQVLAEAYGKVSHTCRATLDAARLRLGLAPDERPFSQRARAGWARSPLLVVAVAAPTRDDQLRPNARPQRPSAGPNPQVPQRASANSSAVIVLSALCLGTGGCAWWFCGAALLSARHLRPREMEVTDLCYACLQQASKDPTDGLVDVSKSVQRMPVRHDGVLPTSL